MATPGPAFGDAHAGLAVAEPAGGDGARFAGINSLRALAAFSVLAFHVLLLPGVATRAQGLFGRLTLQHGVTLFFVISGFLLYRPMARAFADGAHVSLRTFARNRALRIAPLYLVANLAVLPITAGNPLRLLLLSLTFTGVYVAPNAHLLVVGWSLDDEVAFYIFLPLLFILVVALAPSRFRGRAAIGVIATLALASLAYHLATVLVFHVQPFGTASRDAIYRNVLSKFLLFAIGMGLAHVHVHRRQRTIPTGSAWALVAVAVAGVAVASLAFATFPALGDPLMGLASASLLAAVVLSSPAGLIAKLTTLAPITFLGEISYGVYLWQLPLIHVVAKLGVGPRNYALAFLEIAALTSILATITYFAVERPALRFKGLWAMRSAVPR